MNYDQWVAYNSCNRICTDILECKGTTLLVMSYPLSYIPTRPLYHVWVGNTCQSFDNFKEAMKSYDRAIQ